MFAWRVQPILISCAKLIKILPLMLRYWLTRWHAKLGKAEPTCQKTWPESKMYLHECIDWTSSYLHICTKQVAFHRYNYNCCLIWPLLVWKPALEFVDLFCGKVFRRCRAHWYTSRSGNCAYIIPWKRDLYHFVLLLSHGMFSLIKSKVFCP